MLKFPIIHNISFKSLMTFHDKCFSFFWLYGLIVKTLRKKENVLIKKYLFIYFVILKFNEKNISNEYLKVALKNCNKLNIKILTQLKKKYTVSLKNKCYFQSFKIDDFDYILMNFLS